MQILEKKHAVAGGMLLRKKQNRQSKESKHMNIQQERQKSPGQTPKQAQVNQQEKLTTKEHVHPVSARVSENKKMLEEMFGNSADIKMREMVLGHDQVRCLAAYIEITAGSLAFEHSLVGRLLNDLAHLPAQQIYQSLAQNGQGLCDVTPF